MKLPHYLTLSPSGVFHFRLRVPPSHRHALGREIRHSLRTREPHAAQLAAQVFAQRYALAFREGRAVVDAKKLIEEAEQSLRGRGAVERYKVAIPGFEFEANTAAEHRQIVEMLHAARAVVAPQAAPAVAPPAVPAAPPVRLREAVRRYEQILKQQPMPAKTRTQKLHALASFYVFSGPHATLADITRRDVGRWLDTLRAKRNALPTLRNKASYLTAFFTEAAASGLYPRNAENPAAGVISYGIRDKRNRRDKGFQPFTPAQIAALFAPQAFKALSLDARWGAVLGLYTGARVSEIAQAEVADFIVRDRVLCLSINAAGAGKSLKTESSARLAPLHPDLLALGLTDRLAALRAAGVPRFFGQRGVNSKTNGAGNWLSKAWSYYLGKRRVVGPSLGRYGFHSFRKTITQRLQDAQVPAEYRAALLGHELGDVHHTDYSRKPMISELAQILTRNYSPDLDLGALRDLLTESDDKPSTPSA